MKKIVLLLPTYNEKENVESLVRKIVLVYKGLKEYTSTILVIDDYSPDGTGNIIEKLSKELKNVLLISKKKEGLGAAYIFGIDYALNNLKPDILMQIDGDWSHNPDLIPQFINLIEDGADFVVGSRYIRGGSIPANWGIHRKLFSIVGNTWVRFGLGMLSPHDWSSGFRAMRAQVAKNVYKGLDSYSGYTFQIAFLHRVKKLGYKTSEVPLVFVDRIHGRSKFPAFDYIKNVITYVLYNSTLIKYIIIGVIGFSVQTFISKLLIVMGLFEGLSVAIGSFFAIVTNFIGNNFWTFSHNKINGFSKLLKKFIHFVGTSIGAVIIQGIVVSIGVWLTNKEMWFWWMVFAIGFLVIPYNYFIYNRFIWKTNKAK